MLFCLLKAYGPLDFFGFFLKDGIIVVLWLYYMIV